MIEVNNVAWKVCPNCIDGELSWESDVDAEDIGYSRSGTISYYICRSCGAEIEIFVPIDKKEKNFKEEQSN